MVPQVRRAVARRLRPFCALGLAGAMVAPACDKAPLLAPGGTVIFLNATSTAIAPAGSVEIVAVLMEQGAAATPPAGGGSAGAGTPVHNGTLVSFTTTLGRIEPAEARTKNGSVKVRFFGDGRSGAAKILAYSGAARAEVTINVGAAAAERVLLSATPVGSSGGTSTVRATVEDASGNPLPGLTVQFSTTRGALSAATATTDTNGVATVTLSTTGDATVTATVGAKSASVTVTPATRAGLSITAPASITASSPAQFTFSVSTGAAVQNVFVNWGDGRTQNLGAISGSFPVAHTFEAGGQYNVSAVATMSDGSTEPPIATTVSVGEFSVGIACSGTTTAICTATVAPNTTQVSEYRWVVTSSDGTPAPQTRTTTGQTTSFSLDPGNTYTVEVTVVPVIGRTRSNSTVITT